MSNITNWDRIARCAGPNTDVSEYPVYLFGSLSRLDPTPEWMKQFRAEAEARSYEVITYGDHLYVVVPEGC